MHATQRSVCCEAIHPDDHLLRFLKEHPQYRDRAHAEYFSSGRECAQRLRATIEENWAIMGLRILEFAAGYGRVTRHMASVLPGALVTACDIHAEAVHFLARLGVEAVGSSSIPEKFDLARRFDVVFALSFFSHLPQTTWRRWLRRLVDHAEVGGLVIFTTHGEASRYFAAPGTSSNDDFVFGTHTDQPDLPASEYGTALTPFAFVNAQIASLGDVRLVKVKEAGWFGHQDVYVVLRTSS